MPSEKGHRFTRLSIAIYLVIASIAGLFMPFLLQWRLWKGKEIAARSQEKRGFSTLARPEGDIVWIHAVGLGEILSISGLVDALRQLRPDILFLVTSGTRKSAEVFAQNLPPNCLHQFAPLDVPLFIGRFLSHWRPQAAIWIDQDFWPATVHFTAKAGIPTAIVNGRISPKSYARRARIAAVYRAVLPKVRLVVAQDATSAAHLSALGASAVSIHSQMKRFSGPLPFDPDLFSNLQYHLAGRKPWLVASSHRDDEIEAFAAEKALKAEGDYLLILAPRKTERAPEIEKALKDNGLRYARRSRGEIPTAQDDVWLVDTVGEMGLWYRLCSVALVGGSFGKVEGHNPWEPARLGAAILHGPNTANFAEDYDLLDTEYAAAMVRPGQLAEAVLNNLQNTQMAKRAQRIVEKKVQSLRPLAEDILRLMVNPPNEAD